MFASPTRAVLAKVCERIAMGDAIGAAAVFQNATRREPRNSELRYAFGLFLNQLGDPKRAIEQLDECERLAPRSAAHSHRSASTRRNAYVGYRA